eukprot:5640427-Pyramimonas_sp.AAC.1
MEITPGGTHCSPLAEGQTGVEGTDHLGSQSARADQRTVTRSRRGIRSDLQFLTFNGTSWKKESQASNEMETTTKARLQRAKWRVHGCSCVHTEAGNGSGGTMIVSKNHLDAWNPPGSGATSYAGRAARCYLRSGGLGLIALYSVYLKDSTGMEGVSIFVMNSVWHDIFNHGLPHIIAGDFNVSPSEFGMGSPQSK